MTTEPILFERHDDGVAVLTLNNPPLNLITIDTMAALLRLADDIASDPTVRAVVVTGSGDKAFCAGADIKEFADVRDDVVTKKLDRENAALTALARVPVPTFAALNSLTLGGGGEIALACDLRIIDTDARIGFPEILLGVFPGGGGVFRLPRVVGISHALDLLYSGRIIDADEAYRIGLVNEIAPSGTALERALESARLLASRPALALSMIRAGAYDSLTQTIADATARTLADSHTVFAGPDIKEGVAAFFEKRSPVFTSPRSGYDTEESSK
jgi:Enoyl-CoA hydratase/carnithine racemase